MILAKPRPVSAFFSFWQASKTFWYLTQGSKSLAKLRGPVTKASRKSWTGFCILLQVPLKTLRCLCGRSRSMKQRLARRGLSGFDDKLWPDGDMSKRALCSTGPPSATADRTEQQKLAIATCAQPKDTLKFRAAAQRRIRCVPQHSELSRCNPRRLAPHRPPSRACSRKFLVGACEL